MKSLLIFLYKIKKSVVAKILFNVIFLIVIAILLLTEKGRAFLDKVSSQDFIVTICVTAVIVIIGRIIDTSFDYFLEEILKTEDDRHKIISKYSKHKYEDHNVSHNYYNKFGSIMKLSCCIQNVNKFTKNCKKYHLSKKSQTAKNDSSNSKNSELQLPSLNIYANILGNSKIKFNDKLNQNELPPFVVQNATKLLSAHNKSKKVNNTTIRLRDVSFNNGSVLTLNTERTTYYKMLVTNRCMDYSFNGATLREVYEYNDYITPLKKSQLSNQIGINGAVLTQDGYMLIERRDHRKSTWKYKFAQSISSAFREKDFSDTHDATSSKIIDAKITLEKVIANKLKSNYGLEEKDCDGKLDLEKIFLGLARDLLEGGKPNLYFAVTVKYDHKEFLDVLKERSKNLEKEKLRSKYYLVPYGDIKINSKYNLKLKKSKIFNVERIGSSKCPKAKEAASKFGYNLGKAFKKTVKRGCGEALLVTLAYLKMCQNRIDAIKNINTTTDNATS